MTGNERQTARSRFKPGDNSGDRDGRRPKPVPKPRRERGRSHDSIRIFNADLKLILGFSAIAFVAIFLFVRHLVNSAEEHSRRPRVVTPFPAPKVTDLPQFQGEHKESLYWGTYRPHVYLGIRARTPRSLIAGLMWIGVKDGRYVMRHVCQDSDGLSKYGWTQHNGRNYGHQVIIDQDTTLATSFLKSKQEGSGYGGDWAVRIDMKRDKAIQDEEPLSNGHLFFYIADEGGGSLRLHQETLDLHGNSLLTSGSRMDVGGWQLHLKSQDDLEVHYSGFRTPHIHNLSDLVQLNLATQARRFGRLELPNTADANPNIVVYQISSRIPFKIDVAFVSGAGSESSRVEERVSHHTGTSLTSLLNEKLREFDMKFEKNFNLDKKLDSESIEAGKVAIGNMLGGIGYFYGQSKISLPRDSNVGGSDNFIFYWPAELYSAVPSRPFFPRGFLWDEGFHQLLIWRWDIRISLDIIGHWLDLMNIEGWIPREQILGAEALSKVPEEFVAQYPTNGNPPTLFLVLHDLISGLEKNKFDSTERSEISTFLERALVRLEAWFQWFNTTQSGNESGSYYWHGRDNSTTRELNPKTLSSGLDDYPRASHPTEDERHLDLRCWMLLAAGCLRSITELVDKKTDSGKDYSATAKLLSDFDNLNRLHLDDTSGAYFDFGYHTEKVRLAWKEINVGNSYPRRELVREVLQKPELRLVPHVGVKLDLSTKLLTIHDSWILGKQLELISNRSVLWTDFGIRSLAKSSSMYMKRNTEHDPPYWRGPIWINMNYMILSALNHYSKEEGPFQSRAKTIYDDLRSNLIRNVVRNYKETGFLWEQYDQKSGKGKGTLLFTGWTSLVLLIMGEAYPES